MFLDFVFSERLWKVIWYDDDTADVTAIPTGRLATRFCERNERVDNDVGCVYN